MTNKDFFITNWQNDAVKTAKGFRSLPTEADKLNMKHHASFRSPNELMNHIGPHAKELHQAVTTGRMDLVNEGRFDINAPHIYKTPEQGAKEVEEYSAKLLDELKKVDDKTWETQNIPVYWGEHKIFEMPLMQLSWMMLFDSVHHRGQLTSYYRPMGTTQPNLMGPTLEEEEAMMAAMKN